MAPKTLIIKKYENRRLYNTATSQYMNQDQVAQLVREGHDVRVVDAATGEDLTRLILAQIVVEDAKAPDSVFPLDVLRQMIVASGRATQESALHYMKAMLDLYQNAYRSIPPPLNPLESMQMRWPQPAATTGTSPLAAAEGAGAGREDRQQRAETTGENAAETDELKRRIAALEAMLPARRGKKKAGKRRAKSRRKS
ncbi:MAG TPA: polyhydroxyalkanoate synthesis regulator DNA-binding domain-containing protein [Terriglobales bacterium]|nr:polyhydroxyalkanoate synthesis regulator DNA-binding domain-containing protein [Terriglobales bacterium]